MLTKWCFYNKARRLFTILQISDSIPAPGEQSEKRWFYVEKRWDSVENW